SVRVCSIVRGYAYTASDVVSFLDYHRLAHLHSFPTRRSSDLYSSRLRTAAVSPDRARAGGATARAFGTTPPRARNLKARAVAPRSEEHTSELQSRSDLVCRLLLEKKKKSGVVLTSGLVQLSLP